jgi:hypothetical protein
MGIYLDRINNISENIPDINITIPNQNNYIPDMINSSNELTKGYFGGSILLVFWFVIYNYITNPFSNFGLTKTQGLISTSTMIFTLSIFFAYTGLLANYQHFIWFGLLNFLVFILGLLRFD